MYLQGYLKVLKVVDKEHIGGRNSNSPSKSISNANINIRLFISITYINAKVCVCSALKSICCFCESSGFISYHLHDDLQMPVSPVTRFWCLLMASTTARHACCVNTCMWANIHIPKINANKSFKKENYLSAAKLISWWDRLNIPFSFWGFKEWIWWPLPNWINYIFLFLPLFDITY